MIGPRPGARFRNGLCTTSPRVQTHSPPRSDGGTPARYRRKRGSTRPSAESRTRFPENASCRDRPGRWVPGRERGAGCRRQARVRADTHRAHLHGELFEARLCYLFPRAIFQIAPWRESEPLILPNFHFVFRHRFQSNENNRILAFFSSGLLILPLISETCDTLTCPPTFHVPI